MSSAILVENLCKSYRLGAIGGGTLRADVARWLAKLRGKADPNLQIGQEHHARLVGQEFKALQNVSFEVKQGEILGVIGHNGAGKSTLLKILSRVTAPTRGEVKVKGRIASLLEVGTGFHPELSGRENIFLNGAILGMSKAEIRKKFDEIVAFSDVADFIDTPVKRYSSGMYVRLAFAVAAHLEPEILIVDEVLAVGDAAFQAKCLGKMQDVSAKEGRTVLFVSHNLAAVRQLCAKGLLLENGTLSMAGTANEVADRYLQNMIVTKREQFHAEDTCYTRVRLVNATGVPITSTGSEEKAFVELGLKVAGGINVQCGFTIYNQMDVPLVLCASEYGNVSLQNGTQTFHVRLPNELLQPGTYRIEGAVWDANHVYHKNDCLGIFQVVSGQTHEMHGRNSAAQFVLREPWKTLNQP